MARKSSEQRPLADGVEVRPARPEEAEEMLPLMRAYCDFYESDPDDEGLMELMRTLIADQSQGAMFIARHEGRAVGFATLDWKWSSLNGAKVGYLEDLFVDPEVRGKGIADSLIAICADRCRELGMPVLEWLTQPTNKRAQAVYNRIGGESEPLLEYELKL